MNIDTARNILSPLSLLPMDSLAVLAVCAMGFALVALLCAERFRMLNAGARAALRRMEVSRKLMDGNGEYDISGVVLTSPADIERARVKVRKCTRMAIVSVIACAMMLLSALVLLACKSTMDAARDKGYADGWDVSPSALWAGTDAAMEQDPVPADLSGCIVFYYKFGCEDCELLGNELYEAVSAMAPTYRVATRSEQGKTMISKYPVTSVPSCVYVRPDGIPLYYTLYIDKGTEPSVINEDALRDLAQAVLTSRRPPEGLERM